MEIRSLSSQHLGPDRTPHNIRQAAEQFEALLVGQLLKAARSDGGEGWLGGGSDASAAPAIEFAEEQFAAALCARGGLGMAAMIAQSLHQGDRPSVTPGDRAVRVR